MIQIKDISIEELKPFIESAEYRQMPVIPISRHRAFSHLKNPSAAGGDKILFLAYDDDRFVGYLGAMPDLLYVDNKALKVAWLSCMWVDTSQRGKGIAPALLTHAHEVWKGNLLITNFIPIAKRAYDKTGLFTGFKNLPGVRGYLRFNLSGILPEKKPVLKKVLWLLKFTDALLNIPNEIRLYRWKSKYAAGKSDFEYVNYIDDEALDLIRSLSANHIAQKNKDNLQWLMQYPWILNTPFGDRNSGRYIFSTAKNDFRQLYIKLYNSNKKLIAFLILTQRDGHLKIPYLFFDEKDLLPVINTIFAHVLSPGIKTFTTFHPLLAQQFSALSTPFIYKKIMNFRILAAKHLVANSGISEHHYFMEGDGDAAFV
ncbi:MAG: GNAT family N-acetyltransferase [Bacteroidales bacterium]|nr:GNAT family N-acetyltransferase [Bacteroidales bacterium]